MFIGFGMLKGLFVTLINFMRQTSTVEYPDKRLGVQEMANYHSLSPLNLMYKKPFAFVQGLLYLKRVSIKNDQHSRFRGNEFTWFEDRCTGCASCAKYCPLGIIKIVTEPGGIDIQEGESYAINTFDIDSGRCMFCGLCVEACPYDALHMGTNFERSNDRRSDLVITKEELNANTKSPSSWYRPQLEDAKYNPFKTAMNSHKDSGRHEKPTPEQLKKSWVDKR